MDILIVSGFLGAGKTTFIKELVKRSGKEIAVLENDFAGAAVDAGRLSDDSINVWEMTEGCICCSTKGDFALSVLTIANSVDPQILVIEPTGAAFLGNLLNNLGQIEYDRIRLLPPVTIVDGRSAMQLNEPYVPLFKDQIQHASWLIVTKMEQACAGERERVREYLQTLCPDIPVMIDPYSSSEASNAWWHSLAEPEKMTSVSGADCTGGRGADPGRTAGIQTVLKGSEPDGPDCEEPALEQLSLKDVSIHNPGYLVCILERIIRGEMGEVVRAKGQLLLKDAKEMGCQFDVAGGMYSIRFVPVTRAEAVFIGQHLQRQKIRSAFFAGSEKIKVRGRQPKVNR